MNKTDATGGWDISGINWPGVVAGFLLILLTFTGPWWEMHIGSGAVDIYLSPFSSGILIFGEAISSPLLFWLNIAFTILIILFGVLILAGSVLSASDKYNEIAGILIIQSNRKPLYLIIAFTVILAAAGLYMRQTIADSGFIASIPVLLGDGEVIGDAGIYSIQVPIVMEISVFFWLGLAAAIIAVVAGFYQKRTAAKE